MIEQILLIGGSAFTYFVTIYQILKYAVEIQGLKYIFKCPMCGNEIGIEHASIVKCPKCNTSLEVEVLGDNKLNVKVVQEKGEKLFKCIDCKTMFTIPKDYEGIMKCPNCPRRYYFRNKSDLIVKPIPRKKWW